MPIGRRYPRNDIIVIDKTKKIRRVRRPHELWEIALADRRLPIRIDRLNRDATGPMRCSDRRDGSTKTVTSKYDRSPRQFIENISQSRLNNDERIKKTSMNDTVPFMRTDDVEIPKPITKTLGSTERHQNHSI